MKRISLFLLMISLCLSFIKAQTPTTTIDVTDDVYVYSHYSGGANASTYQEDHLISHFNDGSDARYMVFLKFDLTDITEINPEQINSIKLRLYGTAEPGGGMDGNNITPETHTLKVFNMSAANPNFYWTEETLSYTAWYGNGVNSSTTGEGNSGQSDAYFFRRNPDATHSNNNGDPALCISTLPNIAAGTQWYEWDITSTIVNYAGQKIALQICDDYNVRLPESNTKSLVTFHSKENASGNKPHLEITYRNTETLRSVKTIADTYISGSEPHGEKATLTSYFNESRDYRQMIFMKFDLNTPYNPALIESAKVKLYGTAQEGGGNNTPSTHTLDLFDMTSYATNKKETEDVDWDESTFNFQEWNNSAYANNRNPDKGEAAYEACRIYRLEGATGGEKWFEWNISEWLHENMGNTITLQICDRDQIKTSGNQNSLVIFHSKENSSGFGPEIEFRMKKSDLLLSEIKINETALTDFDSYITEYIYTISGTENLPVVSATLKTEGAEISYEQATANNNEAKIIVTLNEEELVYTITIQRDITEIEIPVKSLEEYQENALNRFRKVKVTGDMNDANLETLEKALGSNEIIVSLELSGELSITVDTPYFTAINPNCLIYIPADQAPESWTNVVQKADIESTSLTALTPINLIDGYPFDCPILVKGEASYTRICYNDANWETIILPFSVTRFDEFDNYIVERFESQQENTIRFKEISTLNEWEANKAYLIKSKTATNAAPYMFSNPDATLQTIPNTTGLTGIYEEISGNGKFILNETGTIFGKGSTTATIPAFRGYYLPENPQNAPAQFIVEHDNITGIQVETANCTIHSKEGIVYIRSTQPEAITVHSIDGRLISTIKIQEGENRIDTLNKGVYLIKNQKVIVY